jgi:hypothetical protein
MKNEKTHCVGCGALVPDVDGPTHRYIGASPGCWALYGEILAREYDDAAYRAVHRLTVDAYAVQHPGVPSPQSIQSVAVHLISLYLVLERGRDPAYAARVMGRAANRQGILRWLDPPASLGALTVLDVHAAPDPIAHRRQVQRWARSVWDAWGPHHATVRHWAEP